MVVRAFERHKVRQAERRLAAGADWQKSDFVFTTRIGRPLEGTLVTRDLKRLLAREGLPAVSFHGLRHSCASLLLAAGVPVRDVSELLGHSDVRLTLSTYAHVLEENKTRTASAIDQVLRAQG